MMDHELGDLLNHQCGGCRITRRPRDVENVSYTHTHTHLFVFFCVMNAAYCCYYDLLWG